MASLDDKVKKWLESKVFVTLGTINEDGSPQLSPVWAGHDGDTIIMSTVRGRKKARNLERDPRTSVVVPNPENPYEYVEVRGSAELDENGARELIDSFAHEYMGKERYDMDSDDAVRVTIRVTPEHVTGQG